MVAGDSRLDPQNEFRGTIKVMQVREYKALHFGADDYYKSRKPKSEGVLIGRFKFEEDPNQQSSGVFDGIVTLNWLLDRNGIIQYDDIERESSDNYRNNQCVGSWTSSKNGKPKVANWGEYRIPFSGDLDRGAGEFCPDPKYRENGWPQTCP